jgi:hypothetical protein
MSKLDVAAGRCSLDALFDIFYGRRRFYSPHISCPTRRKMEIYLLERRNQRTWNEYLPMVWKWSLS